MNHVYQNAFEESNTHLTDFKGPEAHSLLKENFFYKIIWAKEKINGLIIDGYTYHLKENQVIFCTPLNHVFIPKNQEGTIAIIFNREFYCIRDNDEEVSCNGFLFYGSPHPVVITLNKKEQDDFEMIYGIFLEEFQDMEKSQGEMVRAMLMRLIIKGTRAALKEQGKQDLPEEKYDLIRKLHILVEKNFKKRHKVSEYADLLCKSPKTLSNVFKKYGDHTPLQIINERLLLEARRLLLFSNKTSEEISFNLGFNEPAHFSNFFKHHMKCSPQTFKKNALLDKKRINLQ